MTPPDLPSRILSVLASARALTMSEIARHIGADHARTTVALIDLRRLRKVESRVNDSGDAVHWSRPDVGRVKP